MTLSSRICAPRPKLVTVWLAALCILVLAACGGPSDSASQDAEAAEEGDDATEVAQQEVEPGAGLSLEGLEQLTLDEELDIPSEWEAGAEEEGELSIISKYDPESFAEFIEPFTERYPYINVTNQDGTDETVAVRTLTEWKLGQVPYDIVLGAGSSLADYKEAGALEPMDFAPAWDSYPEEVKEVDAMNVGISFRLWGVGYNTNSVEPDELPTTWEALADEEYRGRIAVGDRPSQFALGMWVREGPEATTAFLEDFFANDPVRRNEGLNALAELLATGEFPMVVPMGTNQMQKVLDAGGPVSWHSPEPINLRPMTMFFLTKAPHPNAARVFVSWMLSQEGQDSAARAEASVPSHPALFVKAQYYGPFADQVSGKDWQVVTPEQELNDLPALADVWRDLWLSS